MNVCCEQFYTLGINSYGKDSWLVLKCPHCGGELKPIKPKKIEKISMLTWQCYERGKMVFEKLNEIIERINELQS